MKKTAGSSKSSSAPVRSSSTNKNSSRSTSSGRKSSKGKGGLIAAIVFVLVVGTGAVVAGKLYKDGYFEEKIEIVQDDGTVAKFSPEEVIGMISTENFYNGVHIDGIDVSGMSLEEAKNAVAQNQPEVPVAMNISLDVDGVSHPLDMSSLQLEWNIDEVINNAYNYNRVADLTALNNDQLLAQYNIIKGMSSQPYECSTAYTVKTDGISNIVHSELDSLIVEKKDAVLKDFNVNTLEFDIEPSVEGIFIDVDAVVDEVKATLDSRVYEKVITVNVVKDEPSVTSEDIENGYGKISEASSKTTTANSRNHNIRITCEKIDGMILQPGDSFSYNTVVGKRTPENGYERAGVIIDGESKEDYGGGICQVSSMIYQAVVKADLQVDERHEHSWPSSYTDPGIDATVDWGSYDFRFTNNSAYPIVLHTFYNNDDYSLTVQIYGHLFEDGSYIDFIGERTSYTEPTEPEYVANPEMAVGETHTVRSAHAAISACSYQIWYDKDGNEIKRVEYARSYYPMIKAKIEVGVLNEDGSIAPMDPTTGEVTTPEPTPEETEATDPTDIPPVDTGIPGSTDIVPTDTIPSDTIPSDTVPSDTVPTESTEAATVPDDTVATEAPPPEEVPADGGEGV
ncbi:MAG: VanW family protein [Clostridia bacterium]|nr:VanW family protein [Clostridia bacterium]